MIGEDGKSLTDEERAALLALARLAQKWPKTLWLYAANGSLCVMRTGAYGEHVTTSNGGIDHAHVVDSDVGIPCDGGDW